MKFTFLGTGTSQGIPLIGCSCAVCLSADARDKRLRSSLLVQSDTATVLIDAGPDLRQQLLRANINDIDAIVITHEHQDHTAGLDEVRAINFLQNHSIPVYASVRVQSRLKEQYSYIFTNSNYPGIPQIELLTLPSTDFMIGDITLTPLHLQHASMPVTCFRMGSFTYITDANHIPAKEKEKIRGTQHLVLNALRHKIHHSHFTLNEALALADELGSDKAYFTHISHQLGRHKEVEASLPPNRYLAFDSLEIQTNN
jgi:phosphoribosyl 1,2-cyclic phosphate phosphodiesterase